MDCTLCVHLPYALFLLLIMQPWHLSTSVFLLHLWLCHIALFNRIRFWSADNYSTTTPCGKRPLTCPLGQLEQLRRLVRSFAGRIQIHLILNWISCWQAPAYLVGQGGLHCSNMSQLSLFPWRDSIMQFLKLACNKWAVSSEKVPSNMRKTNRFRSSCVSSGPLLSFHIYCSIQWFW